MVHLFNEQKEDFWVQPEDIISLADTGLRGGRLAMRPLNEEHLESLAQSDPKTWPPVKTTLSDLGYIMIDGNHRQEVAKRKGLRKLLAICQPYATENDVVEAAFTANFEHGLRANLENRSDYAYWLHISYPEMEQAEIAKRAHIAQSTVSRAILRREQEVRGTLQIEEAEEEHQQSISKCCRKFQKSALQFLAEVEELDDNELFRLLQSMLKMDDRQKFTRLARLLVSEQQG